MAAIEDYIKKILAVREERQDAALTEADLREIALQAGLTEEDWAALQADFQAHLTRGQGFLKYGNWTDAAAEFEQAAALDPVSLEALHGQASACRGLWRASGDPDQRRKALDLAQRCLALEPGHDPSLRLVSEIRSGDQSKNGRRSWKPFALAGVLLLIGGGVYLLFGLSRPAPDGARTAPAVVTPHPGPTAAPATTVPPAVARPEAPVAPTTPRTPEGRLVAEGLGVPVRFLPNGNSAGLDLLVERSDFNRYERSWAYRMSASVIAAGVEVEELRLEFEYVGAEGQVLFTEQKTVHEDYQPALRSGDAAVVDYLKYVESDQFPKFSEVRVQVLTAVKRPAPASYPPSPVKPVAWPNKPPGMDVEVRERRSVVTQGYMLDKRNVSHDLVLEVRNTGQTSLRMLELRVVYFDKSGKELDAKRAIVNLTSYPSLKPGDVRVYGTTYGIGGLQAADFGRYELSAADVR